MKKTKKIRVTHHAPAKKREDFEITQQFFLFMMLFFVLAFLALFLLK